MVSLNKVRKNLRTRKGFTLIEMLVVVLILGILLAVAIPLYLSSVKNSNVKSIKGNVKILATAAQAYKTKNGIFPADSATLIAGGDIAAIPTGPGSGLGAVTYAYAYVAGSGADIVVSVPNPDQVIGDATLTTVSYDLDTQTWTPVGAVTLFN